MCINKYSNNFLFLAISGFFVGMTACKPASSQQDNDHGHDHGVTVSDQMSVIEEVGLTKSQIENIGLTYTALTPQNIKSTVKLTGRVELPPAGKAIAGSNLEGKVSAVHAMAGRYVQKGQKLFTIQNLDIIDWQQELKMKQSNLIYLEKELARQKELSSEQLAPLKNYESAVNEKMQQEAAIEALRAKLGAIGIQPNDEIQSTFTILAPMSGIIQHLLVSNGQFVLPSTPLAEIISNDHLHLHLIAFGSDVITLEKDQELNFFIQSRPEQILRAKIMWINALVDEENNSYDVHAEIIDDHSELSAGEFVEARVIDQQQVLNVVPLTAVSIDKGLYYIFVREDEHDNEVHFQKVQVQTGVSDLGYIEIKPIDPLPVLGDSVIVDEGSFFLLAESKKGEESGGHEH